MDHNTRILVADIGGTNARFAIARRDNNITLEQIRILSTGNYDSLRAAALAYLSETEGPRSRIPTVTAGRLSIYSVVSLGPLPGIWR